MSHQLSIFDRPLSAFERLLEKLPSEGDPDGLRYYQREAFEKVFLGWRRIRSVLVVMATGTGKTRLFRTVAKYADGPVLVLAHRDELINQAEAELDGIGERVDVEKAERSSDPKTRLVVGSIQSLSKKRLERLGPSRFKYIIVDEAHHALAESYVRVLSWFSEAKVLLVTATPDRGDGRAMGQVADECVFEFDIQDGIEAGYLVPIRGQRIVLDRLKLDDLKKSQGDLPSGELDERMMAEVDGIVQETLRLEPTRSAVCFFPGRRSAEAAADRFNFYKPGSAAYVDGFTNTDTRAAIMAAFKQGRIKYLCNCAVATEGFDAPVASMVVLARPTLSRALYAQMIGRAGRVLPGIVDHLHGEAFAKERRAAIAKCSKKDMMILDFCGNSQKHDLVSAVDVLGGKYTEAERKVAKKIHKSTGGDAVVCLDEARARLKELAQQPSGPVKSEIHSFDPFSVLGLHIDDSQRYAGNFGAKPAIPPQIAKLARWGFRADELNQLSYRAAKKLIDRCQARKDAGLCSFRQLFTLQKFGVTELNISAERATAALDYIAVKKGWNGNPFGRSKMGHVDPKTLLEIIHHQRASGED